MPQNEQVFHANTMILMMLEEAQRLNVPLEECLKGTSITEEDFKQKGRHISIRQEYLLMSNLKKYITDPAYGLRFMQFNSRDLSQQGVYGYTLLSSPTLREAINFSLVGNKLTSTMIFYSLNETDDLASFNMQPKYDFAECSQLRVDCEMAAVIATLSALFCRDYIPLAIHFMHECSPGVKIYEEFFGCKIIANAPFNRVDFPRGDLDKPLYHGDQEVFDACKDICFKKIEQLDKKNISISDQLKNLIENQKRFSLTIEEAAGEMNVSTRTLRRRLQSEGSGFKDILAHARMNVAIDLLENSDLLVEEIAYNLSYSNQSAFTHAFKRWTGISPIEYRDNHRNALK